MLRPAVKTGDSTWQPSGLSISLEDTLKLRSRLILKAYQKFRPNVVLVDHMPVGALGELKPLIDEAMKDPAPPRLFLGLRDVLDRPEVIRRVWQESAAYDYLKYYEAVLIYGAPEIHDSASIYDFRSRAKQVIYCNYVCPEPPEERETLYTEERDIPLILLMGGGGADLFPIAGDFIQAMKLFQPEMPSEAVILPRPNMPAADLESLSAMAEGLPVQVQRGFEDSAYWLHRASAVVTIASARQWRGERRRL